MMAPDTDVIPPRYANARKVIPTIAVKLSADICPRLYPISDPPNPARNEAIANATSLLVAH